MYMIALMLHNTFGVFLLLLLLLYLLWLLLGRVRASGAGVEQAAQRGAGSRTQQNPLPAARQRGQGQAARRGQGLHAEGQRAAGV